jgi:hypothetical protein
LAGWHRLAYGLVRPRMDTHRLRSSSDGRARKCGGKCGVSGSDRLRVSDVHRCDDCFGVRGQNLLLVMRASVASGTSPCVVRSDAGHTCSTVTSQETGACFAPKTSKKTSSRYKKVSGSCRATQICPREAHPDGPPTPPSARYAWIRQQREGRLTFCSPAYGPSPGLKADLARVPDH